MNLLNFLNRQIVQTQKVTLAYIMFVMISLSLISVSAGPGKKIDKTLTMSVTETIHFPLTVLLFDEYGRPYIPYTTTATAQARHLGKSSLASVGRYYVGPFGPESVDSVGELVAANGDVIPFDYAEDLLNAEDNDGVLVLSGGSGRFENAEGFLRWDAGMETETMNSVDEAGAPILIIINRGTMSGILRY
ncbi:hypothetical protein N8766_04200 [bacterium]|jgi:hypothetical protein|nr:hypothetical protein [bacterium]MDA7667572.1 hypothetical protein [bacterium]